MDLVGDRRGDQGPDRYRRYEPAVHDVEVEEVDIVLLEGLEGGVLVAHISAKSGDGELWARTDEVDFFGACHV